MVTQYQFGGLLNDNIYANNVNKKMSLMNPTGTNNMNISPVDFNIPASSVVPTQTNVNQQKPKQGFFSKLIFGDNPPPIAQPINPNQTPKGNMSVEQVEAYLNSIPAEDRLLASMNPKRYMEEQIKMQMGNRTMTTEMKNINEYLNNEDYRKAIDKREGLDPVFKAKIELAQRIGEKGLNYELLMSPKDQGGLGLTSYSLFDEKRDELFAKVANEFYDKGGFAVQETNIKRLVQTIETITKDPSVTGIIQGTLPDELLAVLGYGEAIQTREAVASIVYQTLRATLGAQFTEKEGQRLISASFNPLLSPEQNAVRLNLMLQEVLKVTAGKHERIRHVEKYRTLAGYEGEMPAFDQYKDDPEAMVKAIQAESFDIVSAFVSVDDYAGMSKSELQRYVASLDPDIDNYERKFIEQNLNKIEKNLKQTEE